MFLDPFPLMTENWRVPQRFLRIILHHSWGKTRLVSSHDAQFHSLKNQWPKFCVTETWRFVALEDFDLEASPTANRNQPSKSKSFDDPYPWASFPTDLLPTVSILSSGFQTLLSPLGLPPDLQSSALCSLERAGLCRSKTERLLFFSTPHPLQIHTP